MTQPFDPAPVQRDPRLDALIRAAREQPAPVVGVRVEDIRAAASARASKRWWGGLAAAAVVAISLWAVQGRTPEQVAGPPEDSPVVALANEPAVAHPEPRLRDPEPESRALSSIGVASVEPLEGAREPGADKEGGVVLTGGRYRIVTTDTATVVTVVGRVLEISAATDVVVDAGVEHSSFRIVKGAATWSKPEASPAEPGPGAKRLASRAEAALLSGRLEEAVRLLRQLVQAHPRGSVTKAGLLDLARLEKRLGRAERAHCAYMLFSKRFPTDARTPTVRRADEALGLTARCRGLRPASN